VHIKGKGLLAGSVVLSVPLEDHGASLAAATRLYRIHDETRHTSPVAHELENEPRITCPHRPWGGLYLFRYRLGGPRRVVGFAGNLRCGKLLGKEDGVSDLCGEKLRLRSVGSVMESSRLNAPRIVDSVMLAPPSRKVCAMFYSCRSNLETDLAVRMDNKLTRIPTTRTAGGLGIGGATIFQITSRCWRVLPAKVRR